MSRIYNWLFGQKRNAQESAGLVQQEANHKTKQSKEIKKRVLKGNEKIQTALNKQKNSQGSLSASHLQLLTQNFSKSESLQCSICMDFIVSCRTAVCGHSFCEECISECLLRRKECPCCRKDIRKWVLQKSEQIDQAVKMVAQSKSKQRLQKQELKLKKYAEKGCFEQQSDSESIGEDEQKKLTERLNDHQKWKAKHILETIKPGQRIDVLDTEHIWCHAEVELKIQADPQEVPLILVHYDGWSRKYDEFLLMNSKRVAPNGCYTKRDDIPRYRMCQNQNQPMNYAHVIHNPRVEQQRAQLRPGMANIRPVQPNDNDLLQPLAEGQIEDIRAGQNRDLLDAQNSQDEQSLQSEREESDSSNDQDAQEADDDENSNESGSAPEDEEQIVVNEVLEEDAQSYVEIPQVADEVAQQVQQVAQIGERIDNVRREAMEIMDRLVGQVQVQVVESNNANGQQQNQDDNNNDEN